MKRILIQDGDLRSIILFSSFGAYALIDIIFSKKVLTTNITANYTLTKDIIVIIIGLVVYVVIVYFHQFIADLIIF